MLYKIARIFFINSLPLFIFLLVACNSAAGAATSTVLPTKALTEYFGSTQTPTLEVRETLVDPEQTPTPFIYTVVANDTFFSIAARFNISQDALIAANPGLNARALALGTQLIIPTGNTVVQSTALPTITPVATNYGAPVCYSSTADELWCFVLVVNNGDEALENVTGFVQLRSPDGGVLDQMEAVPPLNVVPRGEQMPLVAYIEQAPDNWASAQAQVLTAFHLPQADDHYLRVNSIDFQRTYAPSGLAARVQGSVDVEGNPKLLWVLAVAYDAAGNVVGVRRWESAGDVAFDFWVYSLGPQIAEVELLAEARP